MLARSTKRQRPSSPRPVASAKRVRQSPADSISRTYSHQDPCVPASIQHVASLNSNEDWAFRVKVIASSTNFDDRIFDSAVRGLVQTCTPQPWMEEVGLDMLELHLKAERAPPENITRAKHVFRSEMIRQLTTMAVQQLSSSISPETAVQAIVDAAATLHEEMPSRNILSVLIGRLQHLEDCGPVHAIEQPLNDHASSSRLASNVHPARSNRISTSWRWDVVPDNITMQEIPRHFQKPSDLYAYHALPIARTLLARRVPKRSVRLQIEDMLAKLSDDQYQEWVEDWRKLIYLGYRNVLDPCRLCRILPGQEQTPAVPARHESQEQVHLITHGLSRTSHLSSEARQMVFRQLSNEVEIKDESDSNSRFAAERLANAGPDGIQSPDSRPRRSYQDLGSRTWKQRLQDEHCRLRFPIVEILLNGVPGHYDTLSAFVDLIIRRLRSRVNVDSFEFRDSENGAWRGELSDLESQLSLWINQCSAPTSFTRIMQRIEMILMPCIVALLDFFPELHNEPFVFAKTFPHTTCVLETLCDPQIFKKKKYRLYFKGFLYEALLERGFSADTQVHTIHDMAKSPNSLFKQFTHLTGNFSIWSKEDIRFLELRLRYLAFEHRAKFPELRSSLVVREWERQTGQTW